MSVTANKSLASYSVPIYGFHRALVIANNDPENRGRVKLFSSSVASNLITHFKLEPGQYAMRFPGDDINGDKQLSDITSSLKSNKKFKTFNLQQLHAVVGVLDWVDQASPLIGSGTIGQLDATRNMSFISDAWPDTKDTEKFGPRALSINCELEGLHEKGPGPVNPNTLLNTSAGYINAAKGMFSIPRVGSTVWVFFEEGEVTRPIYFAYSFSSTESKTIHNDLHAPSTSQNLKTGDPFYTSKMVLNEKGGGIEIVSTDSFEKVRIYDHKGNTVILSKTGISLISKSNLDIDVAGDVNHSVGGRYSLKVKGEHHSIAEGYGHEFHGNVEKAAELQKKWLVTSQPVRDIFTLPKVVPVHTTTVVKDFKKKTPNNKFCFPKELGLKLPPGLDPKILLDKLNKVLNKLNKVINLPLLLIKDIQGAVTDVTSVLKNPFSFLLDMLGNRIKLFNIKLCNDKKK